MNRDHDSPANPPGGAASADPDLLLQLQQSTGLDVTAGLRRTNGRQALYISLLRRFAELEGDSCQRLDATLAAGNWHDAGRQLHNLRGALAMLGASQLGELANALEQAIGAQADPALGDRLKDEFDRRMQEMMDGIARLHR